MQTSTSKGKVRSFGKRTPSGRQLKGIARRPSKMSSAVAATESQKEEIDLRRAPDLIASPESEPLPYKTDVLDGEISTDEQQRKTHHRSTRPDRPGVYICAFLALILVCVGAVWRGNQVFAPEMYDRSGPAAFADAFAKGQNFGTFDLNINIREMRDQHIARLKETPEVAVLGASHWQEAHTELLPQMKFYNAHVHRDYYEDMLAVVEMFVRHDKLPPKLIIAIRDRLFTPVADRTDFLWLPGIPYYRAMVRRLGFEPHPYWETAPVERWRELISTKMLYSNALRWYKADVKPHASYQDHFETLDTLRPGGSIYWSGEHQRLFTPERSERLSKEFAAQNVDSPPKIDPKGIETLDRLLAFLKKKNVEVAFVHPPFNPIYYDRVKNGTYRAGLAKIENITLDFAKKYDFKVFGSFDPAGVGCTADMYIDAEHANPECLGKVFKQYVALGNEKPKSSGSEATVVESVAIAPELPVEAPDLTADVDDAVLDAQIAVAIAAHQKAAAEPVLADSVHRTKNEVPKTQVGGVRLGVVPLPSQRPTDAPPLPTRSPYPAFSYCVDHGTYLRLQAQATFKKRRYSQ